MSAKGDLEEFDRSWCEHQNWIGGANGREPGKCVVQTVAAWKFSVELPNIPRQMRAVVTAELLHDTVTDLLDKQYKAIRERLVKAAIDEAEATLKELKTGSPAP